MENGRVVSHRAFAAANAGAVPAADINTENDAMAAGMIFFFIYITP